MQPVRDLVGSPWFERFIIGVIVLSGVVVGLETNPAIYNEHKGLFQFIDDAILAIFVIEILLKLIAQAPRPHRYFCNGWNVFDFTIVAVCLLPIGGQWVAVIRLARILRTARLITQIPQLQILISALLRSIPSMFYVSLLLGLLFYIYGVLGTFLFRDNDPGHFGNVGTSMVSLFRVITLEDWTDIMYTAYYGSDVYAAQGPVPVGPVPKAFGIGGLLFFLSFVIIGAMVMINLFIGVMVQSLSHAETLALREKLHLNAIESKENLISRRLDSIDGEIKKIKELL
jgi:voltage-gated sodium channel